VGQAGAEPDLLI